MRRVHVGVGIFALSPQFTSQDECDTYTMSTVLAMLRALKKQTTIFFGRSSPGAEIKGENVLKRLEGTTTMVVWALQATSLYY